jgi:hypothetical protein
MSTLRYATHCAAVHRRNMGRNGVVTKLAL